MRKVKKAGIDGAPKDGARRRSIPGVAEDDEIFSMTRTAKEDEVLEIVEGEVFDEKGRPINGADNAVRTKDGAAPPGPVRSQKGPRVDRELDDDIWGKRGNGSELPQNDDGGGIKDLWGTSDDVKASIKDVGRTEDEKRLLEEQLISFRQEFMGETPAEDDSGNRDDEGIGTARKDVFQRQDDDVTRKEIERIRDLRAKGDYRDPLDVGTEVEDIQEIDLDELERQRKAAQGERGTRAVVPPEEERAEDEDGGEDVSISLRGEEGYEEPKHIREAEEEMGMKRSKKWGRKKVPRKTVAKVPVEVQAERLLRRQWLKKEEDIDVDEVFMTVGKDKDEVEEILEQRRQVRESLFEVDDDDDSTFGSKPHPALDDDDNYDQDHGTEERADRRRGRALGLDASAVDDETRRELELPPLPKVFTFPGRAFRGEFRKHVLMYFVPFLFIMIMMYTNSFSILLMLIAALIAAVITGSMIIEAITPIMGGYTLTKNALLVDLGLKFKRRIRLNDISSVSYHDEVPSKLGVRYLKGSARLYLITDSEDLIVVKLRRDIEYGRSGYVEEIIINVDEPEVFMRYMNALLDYGDQDPEEVTRTKRSAAPGSNRKKSSR